MSRFPLPLMGKGRGGGDETMKRYRALSPLPLTPSHQGEGEFYDPDLLKLFRDTILGQRQKELISQKILCYCPFHQKVRLDRRGV